jgi:hypothetical protein
MGVDDPRELREEPWPEDLHETRGHDHVRLVRRNSLGDPGIPGVAVGKVGHPQHEGRHTGALGPREALDPVPIRPDSDHRRAVGGVRTGLEQSGQCGARARDEHDESGGHKELLEEADDIAIFGEGPPR